MLSSTQTNTDVDLFKPNHHLALVTQPLLGARSSKKEKFDSTSISFPANRIEKFHQDKRSNHPESSDSGFWDYSLSSNSSIQYPAQQHISVHRPLSVLNEDFNTNDQPIRRPMVNFRYYHSLENLISGNPSRASSKDPIKKSNDNSHLDSIAQMNQPTNSCRIEFLHRSVAAQQHRSFNDLSDTTQTMISKQKKRSRKKAKLNILIEPLASSLSSSHHHIHDDQLPTCNRITSSKSSQQTTSQPTRTGYQQIKPKARTPLGYYPNSRQTRAYINQSVLKRQHPPYLSIPTRKSVIQQNIPFDFTRSKLITDANAHIGKSTSQNLHVISSRQIKQILPSFYREDILDNRHEKRNPTEKRRSTEMNKWQETSQKELIRIKEKDVQELFKTNRKHETRHNHLDNFLTGTTRRPHEHGQLNQRQQPINPKHRTKPTGFVPQKKIRKTEFKFDYSRPKALLHTSMMENQIKQIHQSNFREKSPIEFMTKLLRTTRTLPMNTNHFQQLSEINLAQENSNRLFPTRSSSSSENETIDDHTDRLNLTNEKQLLDGRYVIPAINSELSTIVDSASQSSSRNTHPFISILDSTQNVDHSPYEPTVPNNSGDLIHHRSCSSSSLDRFSPKDRFPSPLAKVTIAMDEDDISTNYDSNDGWSDDSAELLYIDERYVTQKKKKNISSSSSSSSSSLLHLISQHSHPHV